MDSSRLITAAAMALAGCTAPNPVGGMVRAGMESMPTLQYCREMHYDRVGQEGVIVMKCQFPDARP